jgi:penicillin-binding protein 1A
VAQESVHLAPNYQQVNKAPHFVEHVRRYLEERYGTKTLYRGGFHVYTTLDLKLQRVAEEAVRQGVEAMDKRHGYQGPLRRMALSDHAAQGRGPIAAVALQAENGGLLREGDRLTGVVLKVEENAVQVAVKDTQGVMLPEEGFDWVREPDLTRDFETRRRLTPGEIFQPGDVIRVRVVRADANDPPYRLALEQDPVVQGALIAMEAKTGHVLAMVGGYDYETSQFNRATQAIRQPGSAFKPIIYTAALEAGKTPASVIYDRAVVKEDANEAWMWKPENYSQRYYGATTLRQALTYSRNMVTIRLTEEIGVPAVHSAARRLGLTSPLAPYLSLALGSSGVSLQEITAAMGTFANGGLHVPPIFIHRIVDANDQVIEENLPQGRRAIRPDIAYVMTTMLQDVIENGTGRRVRVLGRPVAGKTGTTNDFRDAWFLGYTPDLVAGVWLGIDDRRVLGHRESGGRVAAPVWLEFMQAAVQGQPITDFPIPPQVRFYRVDAQSGRLASDPGQGSVQFEAFAEGTAPQEAETPAQDLRRNIYRLDRQDRSAARTLQSLDRNR